MHNQLSNESAPVFVSTKTSAMVCWSRGKKKKMSKNIRKVDLIAWTKRLDRTLPFPYHFVHVEGPSSDFFYLPPAQIQFSRQSTQYSTQLFQQPGRCSSPGSLMPFSVFIGVISMSLRMWEWNNFAIRINKKHPSSNIKCRYN